MKNIIFLLLFIILNLNVFSQKSGNLTKEEVDLRNLTFAAMDKLNPLFLYKLDGDSRGLVEFHPFSLNDIGGISILSKSLVSDDNIIFRPIKATKSRIFEGYFVKFQQYYKNVKVEDGSFSLLVEGDDFQGLAGPPCPSCPIDTFDPCLLIMAISPNIYENIDILNPLSPEFFSNQLGSSLPNTLINIESHELRIVNNIDGQGVYNLVYFVSYNDSVTGSMYGWVDADTGDLYSITTQYNDKRAPLADHPDQDLNDTTNGTVTSLENERLQAFDMVGNNSNSFNNTDIPSSPSNRNWDPTDASLEVFQLFWMTDKILTEFKNSLDISFEDVRVGYRPSFPNARSISGVPSGQVDLVFGNIEVTTQVPSTFEPSVEYDVIAHELGHSIIRDFFISTQIEGASLHEGISDMFGVFIESLLEPSGVDWIMGDNMPIVTRNLENPVDDCFNDVENLTAGNQHARSGPLGHWFFLCVNGDPNNNIPPMDISEVMELVLEALPLIGDNPDYPDLMSVIMDLAESKYGTCFDQFVTILRAWEQICVPTGHRMVDQQEPCAQLGGDFIVCEEYGYAKICLTSNTGLVGSWTLIGKNSVEFETYAGQSGNGQQGGNCYEIIEIPEMPYYPQIMTIKYWSPTLGLNTTLTKRIKIIDCDNDDMTCQEYFNNSLLDNNINFDSYEDKLFPSSLLNSENQDDLIVIAFDIMGNKVDIKKKRIQNYSGNPQLLILTYWKSNGEFVKSEKVIR